MCGSCASELVSLRETIRADECKCQMKDGCDVISCVANTCDHDFRGKRLPAAAEKLISRALWKNRIVFKTNCISWLQRREKLFNALPEKKRQWDAVCRNGKRRRSLRRLLYDKMSGRRTIFIALMWCLSIIELLGQQITRPTWVNNLHQATQRNLCLHSPAAFLFLCRRAHFSWNF